MPKPFKPTRPSSGIKRGRALANPKSVSRKSKHEYGDDWEETSKRIRRRDNYTCLIHKLRPGWKCRSGGRFPPPFKHGFLHVHHIIHKSRGGTDAPKNLITLCLDCHWRIHGRK